MPRKFRLHSSKNSERRKRGKSSSDPGQVSGSGPCSESNSGQTSGSDLPGATSDHTSSTCPNESSEQQSHGTAIVSPSPGSEQSVAEGGKSCVHALRSLDSIPDGWSDHSPSSLSRILFCRISNEASSSTVPLQMTHCLKIENDLSWSLFVKQNCVLTPPSPMLSRFRAPSTQ